MLAVMVTGDNVDPKYKDTFRLARTIGMSVTFQRDKVGDDSVVNKVTVKHPRFYESGLPMREYQYEFDGDSAEEKADAFCCGYIEAVRQDMRGIRAK